MQVVPSFQEDEQRKDWAYGEEQVQLDREEGLQEGAQKSWEKASPKGTRCPQQQNLGKGLRASWIIYSLFGE